MAAATTTDGGTRTLTFRIPVDDLTRYAGMTALASGVLAVAGILATVAYLSAWGVPAPVVQLDPLSAALRSETVVFQVGLLGGILFGLTAIRQRLAGRGQWGRLVPAGLIVLLGGLAAVLVDAGASGPTIAIGGAVGLFVAHDRGWLTARGVTVLFTIIALISAYETGVGSGLLIRDDPVYQTPLVMTTRTPVGGLSGGIEDGGAWHYDGLYLVFRDRDSVYVSRQGAGAEVWIVPAGNLMGIGIVDR